MALNLPTFKSDLALVFANASPVPSTLAAQWASALNSYVSGIVPAVTPVARAGAIATLTSALTGIFVSGANPEPAFAAFATALAAGMAPTFTGVPPVLPVGFATEFAKLPSAWATSHATAATLWGDKIHVWLTTGTATLTAPPNTPTTWT